MALKLMCQIQCSSTLAEQLHGSISCIHRMHPDLQLSTLVAKAFLHQARALFTSESTGQKRLQKLGHQQQQLLARKPAKNRAALVYMNDAVSQVRSMLP